MNKRMVWGQSVSHTQFLVYTTSESIISNQDMMKYQIIYFSWDKIGISSLSSDLNGMISFSSWATNESVE